jgi:hypothetical protein
VVLTAAAPTVPVAGHTTISSSQLAAVTAPALRWSVHPFQMLSLKCGQDARRVTTTTTTTTTTTITIVTATVPQVVLHGLVGVSVPDLNQLNRSHQVSSRRGVCLNMHAISSIDCTGGWVDEWMLSRLINIAVYLLDLVLQPSSCSPALCNGSRTHQPARVRRPLEFTDYSPTRITRTSRDKHLPWTKDHAWTVDGVAVDEANGMQL